MIHTRPYIKTWAKRCKDIRKHLNHSQRALQGGNPRLFESLLEQAREAKKFNDTLFDDICKVLQEALEAAKPRPEAPKPGKV